MKCMDVVTVVGIEPVSFDHKSENSQLCLRLEVFCCCVVRMLLAGIFLSTGLAVRILAKFRPICLKTFHKPRNGLSL